MQLIVLLDLVAQSLQVHVLLVGHVRSHLAGLLQLVLQLALVFLMLQLELALSRLQRDIELRQIRLDGLRRGGKGGNKYMPPT